MRAHKIQIFFLVLILGLYFFGFFPIKADQVKDGDIIHKPDLTPFIKTSYDTDDYSFVFSLRKYYLKVRPFVIYNGTYYNFKQIITWIRNNYPDVRYSWILEKIKRQIHYGFNLTRIPEDLRTEIDYIGFRLIDLNFPLSLLSLEESYEVETNQTTTRIFIEKADLYLSFEDLFIHNFQVSFLNRTYVLIGNVTGREDLFIDPIIYSNEKIITTGFSDPAPADSEDLWTADLSGSLLNLDWTSSPYTGGLTKQVRPADSIELTLNFTVYNYTPPVRDIDLNGTDMNDNYQTESITVTANGVYTTTLSYKTINTGDGIDSKGTWNFTVEQNRWGIINKLPEGGGYAFDRRLVFGDGENLTYFRDDLVVWIFTSKVTNQPGQYLIEIKNNCTFELGILDDSVRKSISRPCSIVSQVWESNTYWIQANGQAKNITVGLYGINFLCETTSKYQYHKLRFLDPDNPVKIYCATIDNGQFTDSKNLDLFDIYITRGQWAFTGFLTESTMADVTVRGKDFCFLFSSGASVNGTDLDIDDIYNFIFSVYWLTVDSYILDSVFFSDWKISSISAGTGKILIRYTFNLQITEEDKTPIENANVTITRYGSLGPTLMGTWLTDPDGKIPTQIFDKGYYHAPGYDNFANYNPYEIIVTKAGYNTVSLNYTHDKPTGLILPMTEDQTGFFLTEGLILGGIISLILGVLLTYLLIGNKT